VQVRCQSYTPVGRPLNAPWYPFNRRLDGLCFGDGENRLLLPKFEPRDDSRPGRLLPCPGTRTGYPTQLSRCLFDVPFLLADGKISNSRNVVLFILLWMGQCEVYRNVTCLERVELKLQSLVGNILQKQL